MMVDVMYRCVTAQIEDGPRNESRTHGIGFADRSVDRFAIRGKNRARRDSYPRTIPASTGFVSAAVDDLQGAFAAPFAYPCSVSEASATTVRAPEPLSARPALSSGLSNPVRLTPNRRISGCLV